MAVNARGTMLCYKHAGKQMIAQGRGGRIIGAFPLGAPSLLFAVSPKLLARPQYMFHSTHQLTVDVHSS